MFMELRKKNPMNSFIRIIDAPFQAEHAGIELPPKLLSVALIQKGQLNHSEYKQKYIAAIYLMEVNQNWYIGLQQ